MTKRKKPGNSQENAGIINEHQSNIGKVKSQSLLNDIKKGLSFQLQFVNQNIDKKMSSDIVFQIQKYVNSNAPFDNGTEGVVYKVPIKVDGSIHYFLVAKKRFDHNIASEYNNHKEISKILDKELDFKKIIDIPKLYGQFEDATKNEAYIIMDYIQGKTLFTKIVENIIGINCENDKEAIKLFRDYIAKKTFVTHTQFADLYKILKQYVAKNNIKLFSYKEGLSFKYGLKQFINHIHKNGFYHRDIGDNLRNIIVGDDNKLYVIDFGQSIITNKKDLDLGEQKEIYYSHSLDSSDFYFPQDESLLNTIESLTPMPEKKEPRELQ